MLTLRRLLEKGRVLSKANETKLRTAVSTIQDVLAAVAGGMPMNEAQRAQFQEAGMALLEAELSYDQRCSTVSRALQGQSTDRRYCYIQEMYDSWLVYEQWDTDSDHLYKVSYVIDESTGDVTFGTPIAVIGHMVYEPITAVTESAVISDAAVRLVEAATPLLEKTVRRDGTVPIKIISPGWGSSGFYPANVLERDGPSAFPLGTHMYWNHPTVTESVERPERSLTDLAAVLTSAARWDGSGVDGPGLYADAELKQGYTPAVESLASDIGVSINTSGRARQGEAEGQSGPIIEALLNDAFTSVDFVTKAGAGGKVLQLFEAARQAPPIPVVESTAMTEQEAKALREAQATLAAGQARLENENARLREGLLLRDAQALVTRHLATKRDLLEATKARIATQMAARVDALPVTEAGALDTTAYTARVDEAITIEQTYLASITGAGEIRGMGGSNPAPVDTTALDKQLNEAFGMLGMSTTASAIAATGR